MLLTHHPLPGDLAPAEAFRRLRHLPGAVLLESTDRGASGGRFSFVSADPFAVLSADSRAAVVSWSGGARERRREPPLAVLRELLGRFALDPADVPDGVPFAGGAVGWLGYELGGALEGIVPSGVHDPRAPLLELGLYDVVLGWDHLRELAWLVSTGFPHRPPAARNGRALERRDAFLERLSAPAGPRGARAPCEGHRQPPEGLGLHPVPGLPGVASTFSPEGYRRAVEKVRSLVLRGDVFQANLSQRFQLPFRGDPFGLHLRLARAHPAPFAAYLETDDGAVVSASPESFLRVRGHRVEARPIKGTAPRGETPQEDDLLARRLLESEKDRAENVMIVDLLRNDLSRVCEPGSVRAAAVCVHEAHPTVHHLVSVVEGRLSEGRGSADLLECAFPGGSITGAPKLRAMEILAGLEPTARGVYTGSLGWMGFHGDMELSIAIRTVCLRHGVAYVQAGGGIVLDSDPEEEWRETIEKVRGLLEVLEGRGEEVERGGGSVRRGPRTAVGAGLPPEPLPEPEPGPPDLALTGRPRVAVLDHRDSFVHNLARCLRELGARVRVFRADRATLEEIEALDPTHLVLSPGPCTPREFPLSGRTVRFFAGRIPILGVCLGHLSIADALGGGWSPATRPLHGRASPVRHVGTGLFRGLPNPFPGARYHSLALASHDVPEGMREAAWTDRDEIMAVEDRERRIWGLQFHPESVLTPDGRKLLRNFLEEAPGGRPVATGAEAEDVR